MSAPSWRMPEAYTGERLAATDPRFAPDMARHLAAYDLVAPMVAGQRVLEAGCGEGYGASLLAEHAAQVVGIDYDAAALGLAQRRHVRPNLEFRAVDLMDLSAEVAARGGGYDVVTNFQVIEHLTDPGPFLRAAAACLRPGGTLILTTPNRPASVSENPYHVREYTAAELAALLAPYFGAVEVRGIAGNDRAYAFEQARGAVVQRFLRLDPLGLRRLLPERLVRWVFARLALMVRSRVAAKDANLVRLERSDFVLADREPPLWLDLVAIARRA